MVETGGGNTLNEDCNTKKVRFKGLEANTGKDMAIDLPSVLAVSWRDKVLGRGYSDSVYKEDLDFIERDITRSIVNGIHAINFFERIQNILGRLREGAYPGVVDYFWVILYGPPVNFGL
ncbi:hypothetical protein GOBAR_AA13127 [Gossypium barbadense]|uniref:Uncharacterized protein n=1 Tax=Gossypium barbadense TaxID=3634 RepID=A0A2P5XW23_GOSBA|nr:hypothetical protein GOBAR_AA13127 [Gossypium barbadense]